MVNGAVRTEHGELARSQCWSRYEAFTTVIAPIAVTEPPSLHSLPYYAPGRAQTSTPSI